MAKRNKGSPKAKVSPILSKQPSSTSDPDRLYDIHPTWRVAQIELCDPFGWHVMSSDQFLIVKDRLAHFESMTWREILVEGSKFHHQVKVDRLSKSARERLAMLGQDDLDELVSLRLASRERIWGILDRGSLNLLWWDPEHKICPSVKKHT